MIKFIKNIIEKIKKQREFNRKLKELKKRDPFTYKH